MDTRQVDASAAAPRRQVRVDLVDGLVVEPSASHGPDAGTRKADQRHPYGRSVNHPGLVTPRLEDPPIVCSSL